MSSHPLRSLYLCRCAYVLVCELDENRLLAETVLALLTRLIRDHVTCLEQKNAEVSTIVILAFLDYPLRALF